MFSQIIRYVRPRIGRFSESQLERLGRVLQPVAFLNIGPFVLLIDLPDVLQKHDPAPVELDVDLVFSSVDELNSYLREHSKNSPPH